MLKESIANRLYEYGQRFFNPEYLFDKLPDNIFITIGEKRNKRLPANFVFTRKDGKWIGTLNTMDSKTKEVFILHRVAEEKIIDAVGEMLVFLYVSKIINPNT